MAESEGFEPPIPFRVRRFSRPMPSTTRPALRSGNADDCNQFTVSAVWGDGPMRGLALEGRTSCKERWVFFGRNSHGRLTSLGRYLRRDLAAGFGRGLRQHRLHSGHYDESRQNDAAPTVGVTNRSRKNL